MSASTMVPGSQVTQASITPDCRLGRGAFMAWDEAVRRLREQYDAIIDGWADEPVGPTIHLTMTMERP
jgi:hypothetical protein